MEEQDKITGLFEFSFSPKLKEDFRTVAIWARFSAIVGFITSAYSLIQTMAAGNFLAAIIMGIVNVLLGIYLFNFGNQTKKGVDNTDQPDFEEGLNNFRLYFKTLAIVAIVAVIIIVLAVIYSSSTSSNIFRL